jgi:hypothetical protein
MPSLAKSVLADHLIAALGSDLLAHGDIQAVPLKLSVQGLVPMAVYAFTVSDPPGGRDAGELKIQLIAPGQKKGERANLEAPDDESYVILLGYSADYDVFVLWDAYKHREFAFSKNCQVRLEPIKTAQITGLGYRDRILGDGSSERIIVARPDQLANALGERIRTA